MMKKYRKSMIRTISLILSVVLLIGSMAVPASADELEGMTINGLDYVYATESFWSSTTADIAFGFATGLTATYIDALIRIDSSSEISSVTCSNGSESSTLNIQFVTLSFDGNDSVRYYRIYGDIGVDANTEILMFSFSGNFLRENIIDFMSLTFSNGAFQRRSELVTFGYEYDRLRDETTQMGTTPVGWNVNASNSGDSTYILYATALQDTWKKYDYAEFVFRVGAKNVSSVSAFVGDAAVPCYAYNITGESYTYNTDFVFRVLVDLRGVKNQSGNMSVFVRGEGATFDAAHFYLVSNNFILVNEPASPVISFLRQMYNSFDYSLVEIINNISLMRLVISNGFSKVITDLSACFDSLETSVVSAITDLHTSVSNWFTVEWPAFLNSFVVLFELMYRQIADQTDRIINSIKDGLGMDDTSGQAAQQTQQELNTTVNNQIVGAVQDWDTHIEAVQTGYDSAFLNATPALAWLGSLAESVFTNMGWFSNIYFLVGLMSVFMLLLSKSGIAHKISGVVRSGRSSGSSTSGKGPG